MFLRYLFSGNRIDSLGETATQTDLYLDKNTTWTGCFTFLSPNHWVKVSILLALEICVFTWINWCGGVRMKPHSWLNIRSVHSTSVHTKACTFWKPAPDVHWFPMTCLLWQNEYLSTEFEFFKRMWSGNWASCMIFLKKCLRVSTRTNKIKCLFK